MSNDEIRIVRVPYLFPGWATAQVLLPRTVFLRNGCRLTTRLLAHELVHLEQLRRLGLLRYWLTYLGLLLRWGYREHPMEMDAIVRSAEPRYLDWAKRIIIALPARGAGRGVASGHPLDVR